MRENEIHGLMHLRSEDGGKGRAPSKAVVRKLQEAGLVAENGRTLTALGTATAYRVIGPRCGECADCQEWRISKQDAKACLRRAIATAKYFGAECAANPGTSILEYQYDMAIRTGHASWHETPVPIRRQLTSAFLRGKRSEDS